MKNSEAIEKLKPIIYDLNKVLGWAEKNAADDKFSFVPHEGNFDKLTSAWAEISGLLDDLEGKQTTDKPENKGD